MYPTVRTAIRKNLTEKWSTLFSFLFLICSALFLVIPFKNQFLLLFPFNFYVTFFGAIWAVIFRITNKLGKNTDEEVNITLLRGLSEVKTQGGNIHLHNFDLKREIHRKILHGLAVLYILGLFLHGVYALLFRYTYACYPHRFSIEEYHNAYISISGFLPVKVGFIGLIMGLLGSFFVQIHMEILRLRSPKTPGILKKVLQETRRVTEVYTFSAHIPLIIGFITSTFFLYIHAIFLPQYGFISLMSACNVIVTASLADATACLIGRKFGKKYWSVNHEKTILGTLCGAIVALLVSSFFIGWFAGVITVTIFMIIDIFSNKIHITDNLFYPLVLSVIYSIFLPLFNPILSENWFFISLLING